MDITPSAVTSELAAAALASPALSLAIELATWIGDGKKLTASGTLRPAAAAEACRALGIELPAERHLPDLRSVNDVPQLAQVWEVAVDAGFITLAGEYARGSGVPAGAEAVLRSWLRALARKLGLPDQPCARCLTVLARLAGPADGVASMAELMDAVRLAFPLADSADGLARELRHAVSAVADLLFFAAAVPAVEEPEDDDRVRLTPLGRMLADSVFAVLAIDAAAGIDTVVAMLSELPPGVSMSIARPWLAARTPTGAVTELLGFAESAGTQQRAIAVSFAKEIGPQAAAAWREYAGAPGFGAYAREWLARLGEEVADDPRDEAWLTVESISVAGLALAPEAVSDLIRSAAGESGLSDLPTVLALLRESEHPDADQVAEAISEVLGPAPQRGSAGSATVVRVQPRAKKKRSKRKR